MVLLKIAGHRHRKIAASPVLIPLAEVFNQSGRTMMKWMLFSGSDDDSRDSAEGGIPIFQSVILPLSTSLSPLASIRGQSAGAQLSYSV